MSSTLSVKLTDGTIETLNVSPIGETGSQFRLLNASQETLAANMSFDFTNERGGTERVIHFFNSIQVEQDNNVYTLDKEKYFIGNLI